MALVVCSECGGTVSTAATSCPACGAPVGRTIAKPAPKKAKPASQPIRWKKIFVWAGSVSVVFLIFLALKPEGGEPRPASNTSLSRTSVTAEQACFGRGADVAKLFISNIDKAIEANVRASQMMAEACTTATEQGTDQCRIFCEDGFRWQSKKSLEAMGRP